MAGEGVLSSLRLLAVVEARTLTGPAKNLLEFASLAKSEGIETHIATFPRGEDSNLFVETARAQGTPVHTIPERGRFDRTPLRGLAALVAELKPEIVQTHAVKSHFLARVAGLARQHRWVAFHHGYTWPEWWVHFYNQLDRWSLRAAVKVLTVSGPFRAELIQKGVPAERIEIVHNAIGQDWGKDARTPDRAAALRSRSGIPKDRPVILNVGRLSAEKDHLTLLEAMRHVEAHLVIVGEGPERARIEQHIREFNLAGAVTLTGQQPSAEPYYGIADIAVLSSRTEGSPNALLEAMAAGVPVVATAVGGVPEMVSDGESALLVEPGNAPALAEAITRLLRNREVARRLANRAQSLVRERHTPEIRMRRLAGIYRGVMG
jgi:glycosyltransferase involved in cell wall biosynthesis